MNSKLFTILLMLYVEIGAIYSFLWILFFKQLIDLSFYSKWLKRDRCSLQRISNFQQGKFLVFWKLYSIRCQHLNPATVFICRSDYCIQNGVTRMKSVPVFMPVLMNYSNNRCKRTLTKYLPVSCRCVPVWNLFDNW